MPQLKGRTEIFYNVLLESKGKLAFVAMGKTPDIGEVFAKTKREDVQEIAEMTGEQVTILQDEYIYYLN